MHAYTKRNLQIRPKTLNVRATNRSWFLPTEVKTIYNFPNCPRTPKYAVISFGGGLVGTVQQNGTVTGGDLSAYWSYLGLTAVPTVKIVLLSGSTNDISDEGSTAENTLDVQTIGACRPESTIVLVRVPNTFGAFATAMNYILNDGSFTNVSISWGAPEIYFPNPTLQMIDALFASANTSGITICAATGDFGSNNGVGGSGSYADFPASSPNVIACGGTKLICPNTRYDTSTTETAWSLGGGARSAYFARPAYQNAVQTSNYRSIPDVSLVADPNTGVLFYVYGSYVVYGGTSVAAPLMAAAIGGLSSMLPKLYTFTRSAFHDIVSGSNGAFSATAGYDLCTGLGSINGSNFVVASPATDLSLNLATWVSSLRKTVTLSVTELPTGSLVVDPYVWSTSNASVVSLSKTSGASVVLLAVSAGTATVTVTSGSLSRSCLCTITAASIRMQTTTVIVRRSKTYKLVVLNVLPGSVTTWTSSNTRIATVNSSGLVTGISSGTCTISASNNGTIVTCKVTVK